MSLETAARLAGTRRTLTYKPSPQDRSFVAAAPAYA